MLRVYLRRAGINGTSGYEETAAQGLLAGANAVLYLRGGAADFESALRPISGCLWMTLITKGIRETLPYSNTPCRIQASLET